MRKISVNTSIAFLIWAGLLTLAFWFTTKNPNDAPFWTYSFFLTLGLTLYGGRRLFKRFKGLFKHE